MRRNLARESPRKVVGTRVQTVSRKVHDLRNPASGILSAAESLLDDLQGDEKHAILLHAIESASRQLLRVIDDLESKA